MKKEVKNFAKAYIEIYRFKNFYLDSERFGILELTREVNRTLELDDNEMYALDNYIREEIVK